MATHAAAQGEFAWAPSPDDLQFAELTRFMQANGKATFDELHRWSIEDVPAFTEAVLRHLRIRFHKPYTQVLDLSAGIEWPRWCVGAQMNIIESCLAAPPESLAIIWEGEEGTQRTLTYAELAHQVARCAAGLKALGINKADAVGIHLPMMPETVVALLAIGHIGAIAVPLFSGYGPSAIESRLRDVEAKVLITSDGFPRRGANVDSYTCAREAADRVPSVQHIVVVPRLGRDIAGTTRWSDLLASPEAPVEHVDPEHPLLILYTSGTTGKPKGIVHSHCGFPIKSAQDMCFGTNVRAGTRIHWLTDIGWMMGPWLIYGSVILGGTMVLYDGAPDFPHVNRVWELCSKHAVNVFGVSPTLIRVLSANDHASPEHYDLTSLTAFGSTGEPWNPEPWQWLFDRAGKRKIPIINYSGGTEISGGILMGNPLLPIKPCSFPAPCPGIDADIVDEHGKSLGAGQVGELVIRSPWIGMARGFLRDPRRYLETYWSRWPGVWAHGDWAMRDESGQWFILGRSDDTLKIAGKRVGPAEVESVLVSHDSVVEAAVIGIPDDRKGEAMVAFCVLSKDVAAHKDLAIELRNRIGTELGKPLRPEAVHFIAALPKTRNAKVMRRVIRAAYLEQDAGDLSALENPGAVDFIRQARESQS